MCTKNATLATSASGLSGPKALNCSAFRVDNSKVNGYYVSDGRGMGGYVHRDFSVNQSMGGKNGRPEANYFTTKGEATAHLAEFRRRCRLGEGQNIGKEVNSLSKASDIKAGSSGQPVREPFIPRKANNFFLIDHDRGEVEQFFGVRLVQNEDSLDVTLEVATPHSGEDFISLARLEFKGGRVVMYREQGAFDPYIETDEKGRIQN